MIRLSSLGNLLLGGLLAAILTYLTLTLPHEPQGFVPRPVEFKYGSTITLDLPGQQKQAYFRWCDSGYLLWSNGFSENSPIFAARDSRCDGVR